MSSLLATFVNRRRCAQYPQQEKIMIKKLSILLSLLSFISCGKSERVENLEDLEYLPVTHSRVLMSVDEETNEEFPTLIKFNKNNIVISRFQDSNENSSGYENVNLKIKKRLFIDDKDSPETIYETDYNIVRISSSNKNPNLFYINGLDPNSELTFLSLDRITLEMISKLSKQ